MKNNWALTELGTLIGYISLGGPALSTLGFRQSIGLGPGKVEDEIKEFLSSFDFTILSHFFVGIQKNQA